MTGGVSRRNRKRNHMDFIIDFTGVELSTKKIV